MPENPQEPQEYDAVLGGKNPPLPDNEVLGGIEALKIFNLTPPSGHPSPK
ncbi:MAG: hypothetical protein KI793_05045 [Rivularia sp. (in: Bacteria)]|nr:hypothetical protein [Rivularia sp. MS3]